MCAQIIPEASGMSLLIAPWNQRHVTRHDEVTDTPLGTKTCTKNNQFSTKSRETLLVTNATEYLCVCVCLLSRERIKRASYTREDSGSLQKRPFLSVALHIFVLMSKS